MDTQLLYEIGEYSTYGLVAYLILKKNIEFIKEKRELKLKKKHLGLERIIVNEDRFDNFNQFLKTGNINYLKYDDDVFSTKKLKKEYVDYFRSLKYNIKKKKKDKETIKNEQILIDFLKGDDYFYK
jgi:hypothetical protein